MISNLAHDYAAVGTDEKALEFLYTWAKNRKDIDLLVQLARRNDLPQSVATDIKSLPMAPVVTARLTRDGVSHEELVAAGSDKRVGVQTAVAGAAGLPDEVYETLVAKAASVKVLVALARNENAGVDWRIKAVETAVAHPKVEDLSWSVTYELNQAIEELIVKDSHTAKAILDADPAMPFQLLLAGMDSLDSAVANELARKQLDFFDQLNWTELEAQAKAQASSKRFWAGPMRPYFDQLHVLDALSEYDDFDKDLYERFEALLAKSDAISPQHQQRLAGIRRNKASKTRPNMTPARSENVEGAIAASIDLGRRCDLVKVTELDDEDFRRLVREGTSAFVYEEEVPAWAQQLIAQSLGNPQRAGAVLSRLMLGPQAIAAFTSTGPVEIMKVMYQDYQDDVAAAEGGHAWHIGNLRRGIMHAGHLLGQEAFVQLPADVGNWVESKHYGSWYGCCDEGASAVRIQVIEQLWKRFGDDENAWNLFDTLAGTLPATFEEALDTVEDSLKR